MLRCRVIRKAAIGVALWAMLPHGANATGADPATVPQVDPAPCLAAAVANEDDRSSRRVAL